MSRVKAIFLLFVIFLSFHYSRAQRIIDSVEVHDFPVKKGVVYSYDYGLSGGCRVPGISIITKEDSLFHFEDGKVIGITCYNDSKNFCMVVIKTVQNKYICYSNLNSVAVKKGDELKTGMLIGTINTSDSNESVKELEMIIMLDDIRSMAEKRVMEYINCSKPLSGNHYTL